jgi:fucose 4-O-acetylase-like acetyltransferase
MRLDWIDQARGLSIFLVVYAHNFPIYEPYIYSFHVPLFFFISGMFHPKVVNKSVIKRRAKMILIPYFFWAFLLYFFWLFVGRKYGVSSFTELSPIDNFIGIFYAQGGKSYMDWGIPIWFLPCIFMVFLVFSATRKIKNKTLSNTVLVLVILVGFLWSRFVGIHLPWSLDVALVAMGFYATGNIFKNNLIDLSKKKAFILGVIFLAINITTFYFNIVKIDIYRSIYGIEVLFFISGLTGSLAYILLLKSFPVFKFLSYLGKHTIVLLATHLRALTIIKLVLLLVTGITIFEFSESEKVIFAVVQILLVIPIIWLVNKYVPILDGKVKKP